MKKRLFLSIVVILLGCGSLLAQNDGFFNSNFEEYREENSEWGVMPSIPASHGYLDDYSSFETPLGSGFLLLAGMGIAYGIRKRKKE